MKRLISIELRATLDRHVSAPRLGWRGLGHQIRCIAATPAEASVKSIPAPPTAASSDAIGVTVTSDLPCAPPPGSSPVCIDDADQELYSISHCLFGLTDMGTGVISLITPTTRVEQKMPLLAKWAKRELFFGQYDQWLSCLMWRSGRMLPRPAAVPPHQLAESAAGEAEGHTHTPLSENGDVHVDADVSSDATATALPQVTTEVASEATAAASGGGDCAPLLTHMDVVGRSKIVRHMLLQYVQDPCLWWDQVRELISLAHGHHRSVVEASDHLLRPATGLVLYSAGLMTLLMDVLSMTTASFAGPKSFWYAFVITWRQNRQLPSPQRKPFSYGEVVPTLTPVDFDRRHFGAHVVQEEDPQSAEDGVDDALASMSTEAWEGLPEDEQNKILFGDYDASATRSLCVPGLDPSSGIYIYDDAGAEDHIMEETATEETEGESPVEAPATIHDPRAAEQQKMLVYEMDRFLLGIIEPATTRQLSQASYAAAAPSVRKPKKRRNVTGRPKHEYLSGGRFRNASNGELEDVHLSRLWEAFQNTETTVILDAYTSVRGRLESIQTTIRSELATQIAFSMLFLSRDEVRAITAPQETYERLWRLHTQLRDIIAGPLQEEVNDNNNNKKSSSDSELPPYAELPPAVQVSYTCFGAAHLPSSSPMGHANSTVEDSHSHSLVKAESPFELFRSYVAHFDREEATVGEGVATTPHATLKNMTCEQHRAIFDSLSDLQSFSLTWCYPRNADEQSELNLLAAPAAVLEMLREETAVELIPVDASPPPAPGGRRRGRPSKASLAARQEALAADAAVAALSASGGDEGDTNTTATVEDEDYEEEEEDVPAFSSAEGETESTTTHSSSASAQVADCEDTADTPAHDDSIIRGAVEEITQTLLVNGTPAVEAHIRAQVKKIVSVVADDIATRLLQSLSQLSQAEGGEELTVKKRRKEKAVVTRRSQKKEKKKSQQPSTIITAPEREEKKQKPMKKGRKRQDGSAAATAETPHGVDDDDVQRIIEEFESRRGRTPGRKKRKKRGSSQRHEDGDT